MPVIQFTELGHLCDALPPRYLVRVETLEVSEWLGAPPTSHRVTISVRVRAIDPAGNVLAWYRPIATLVDDPGPVEAAWHEAQQQTDLVRGYLRRQGFNVQPGLIDLGDIALLPGLWPAELRPAAAQPGPLGAVFADPDQVGQSEYRAILDTVLTGALDLDECDYDPDRECDPEAWTLIRSMLDEFAGWSRELAARMDTAGL
ncbi:MAG: hypothetical protein KKA73_07755 [Chloroflexi bacterium]|nr:hypothetical protein [Chloroflexota bacterium]MBU1747567.1 hypothetical protein [Chloroflexota bacterium]